MANLVVLGPEYYMKSDEGVPVSGGSIYVGDVDTDPEIAGNQKQVQALQEDGTFVNITQPVTLGGGGVPLYNGSPVSIYVNGDYSLKVLDSDDVQVYYIPLFHNYEDDPLIPGGYNYPVYTEPDQGDVGNDNTVKYFVDQIGGTNKATLYFKHNSGNEFTDYIFLTSEVTGDNITLEFEPGARINPATGISLTVYSPEHIIKTSKQHIVNIANNSTDPLLFTILAGVIEPEMWGAIDDAVYNAGTFSGTDSSVAFDAMVACIQAWPVVEDAIPENPVGVDVSIQAGVIVDLFGAYMIDDLKVPTGTWLRGKGPTVSALISNSNSKEIIAKYDTVGLYAENNIQITGLRVVSQGTGSSGIVLDTCDFPRLKDVVIHGAESVGLHLKKNQYGFFQNVVAYDNGIGVKLDNNSDVLGCNNNTFLTLKLFGNTTGGLQGVAGQMNIIRDLTCQNNSGYGIKNDSMIQLIIDGAHFEFQEDIFDIINTGRSMTLTHAYFFLDGTETERRINNSGSGIMRLVDCGTGTGTDHGTVDGTEALFETNASSGQYSIEGGTFGKGTGAGQAINNLVCDSAGSVAAGRNWSTIKQYVFGKTEWWGTIEVQSSSSTEYGYKQRVVGETYERFKIRQDGILSWGVGVTDVDVTFGRKDAHIVGGSEADSIRAGLGTWNAGHLILGGYHIWVDSTGDLRINNGVPSGDTDGTVVGTQS